jgi:hypothetical protein
MEELRVAAPRSMGYGVVLVGALAFVAGSFLPYVTLRLGFAPSLFQMQTMRHEGVGWVGAVLILFTGVLALAITSSVGIRRPLLWTAIALVAVAPLWALETIGFALGASGLWPMKAVGYWVVLVAVGVVATEAVMVGISVLQGGVPERPDGNFWGRGVGVLLLVPSSSRGTSRRPRSGPCTSPRRSPPSPGR